MHDKTKDTATEVGYEAKKPDGNPIWVNSKQARDAYTAMISKLSKVPEK